MGKYIVNGQVVDIPGNPTARTLKNRVEGARPDDWVVATKPDGEIVPIRDDDNLPTNARDYTIVPPFEYGADFDTAVRVSRLQYEAHFLGRKYGTVQIDRQDGTWVHIKNFEIPPGWNKKSVQLLIDIPHGTPGYPSVTPQWFWTDQDLRTSDGLPINHFFVAESSFNDAKYVRKGWGHFCIHLHAWHPSVDISKGHSLVSYLDLISYAFRDRKNLTHR
ncbi:E2/UBC family protein [Streptomyces tibetensis]|uniref:E2/UBC family protein n=1 Tax=Streptomyces tibetensis TaxID=2382123 RepID=UPI0038224EE3